MLLNNHKKSTLSIDVKLSLNETSSATYSLFDPLAVVAGLFKVKILPRTVKFSVAIIKFFSLFTTAKVVSITAMILFLSNSYFRSSNI